ncbi:hypothetical protein DB313_04555 (plasmid) [Borrelia turcica IST7]|uniref:DUF3996 domain-containing protein n=1 Tax=Borrelia turcica IST7 TaxID=1104446 RepID=A0A386PP01_9SPIR|nr:hypothetical protein DB313_04555 [Borrelia turcica IST7]
MKKLILTCLISLLYIHSFCDELNTKTNYSHWGLAGDTTNFQSQPLQIGIIQHNYINLNFYNEHYKYAAFIGITLSYNEWLELNFIPINFILYPLHTNFILGVYFTSSLTLYILKYQTHINSLFFSILIGPQILITLRSAIIAGYTTSAFLYPAFPYIAVKFNLSLTNRHSIFLKLTSSFNEFFFLDFAFNFAL